MWRCTGGRPSTICQISSRLQKSSAGVQLGHADALKLRALTLRCPLTTARGGARDGAPAALTDYVRVVNWETDKMESWSCSVCGMMFECDRAPRKHVILDYRVRYDKTTRTVEPFHSGEAEERAYFCYCRAQLSSRRRHRLDVSLHTPP